MPPAPALPRLNVLVIEDDPDVCALLARSLVRNGVGSVMQAARGEQALLCLQAPTNEINFVLCDWNLPGVSGIELCRKLKAAKPILPVLMMTGRADIDSVKMAQEAGIDGYLIKPVSPRELLRKIQFTVRRAHESRMSPLRQVSEARRP